MNPAEKKILTVFKKLPKPERENLQAFAEFLLSRPTALPPEVIPEPQLIPRKENESVVAAIKRLSASYPMLDRPELLNETSTLMTQHIMQGRDINEVIDELEALFARFYNELLQEQDSA
ncbi:MAG: Crp/Fnr family transcriptional regulator [Ectothiorhodospiraceae bacterium]|nr:Crp/Fnr family transcriptional regulator [Ectothiorhodospiraceae bacterium]